MAMFLVEAWHVLQLHLLRTSGNPATVLDSSFLHVTPLQNLVCEQIMPEFPINLSRVSLVEMGMKQYAPQSLEGLNPNIKVLYHLLMKIPRFIKHRICEQGIISFLVNFLKKRRCNPMVQNRSISNVK